MIVIILLAVALISTAVGGLLVVRRVRRTAQSAVDKMQAELGRYGRMNIAYRNLRDAATIFSKADKTMISMTMSPADIKAYQLRATEVARNTSIDELLVAVQIFDKEDAKLRGFHEIRLVNGKGGMLLKTMMVEELHSTYQEVSPLGRLMEYRQSDEDPLRYELTTFI